MTSDLVKRARELAESEWLSKPHTKRPIQVTYLALCDEVERLRALLFEARSALLAASHALGRPDVRWEYVDEHIKEIATEIDDALGDAGEGEVTR